MAKPTLGFCVANMEHICRGAQKALLHRCQCPTTYRTKIHHRLHTGRKGLHGAHIATIPEAACKDARDGRSLGEKIPGRLAGQYEANSDERCSDEDSERHAGHKGDPSRLLVCISHRC